MPGKGNHKYCWLIMLVLGFSSALHAQNVEGVVFSMEKRVEIGRPFEVDFRIRHPEGVVVIFPDSLRDFAPFELHSGKPLPTQTDQGISVDAIIYKLYTWEIDSIQFLQFPARYIDKNGDTVTVLSNREELEFLPKIARYTDSLKVVMTKDLVVIHEPVDWQLLSIILGAVILLVLGGLYFLWLPIGNMVRRWKINREWKKYLVRLAKVRALLPEPENYISELNKVWKTYFDHRRDYSLESCTTMELQEILPNIITIKDEDREALLDLSASVDQVLYARQNIPNAQLEGYHSEIQQIMEREYQRRKRAVEI